MGATAHYRRLTPRLARAAQDDTALLGALLRHDAARASTGLPAALGALLPMLSAVTPEMRERAASEGIPLPDFNALLGAVKASAVEAESVLAARGFLDDARAPLNTGKALSTLKTMLEAVTTSRSPARSAVRGGTPFGEDLGYGQARVLGAVGVVRTASALARVDAKRLAKVSRAQGQTMLSIGPGKMSLEPSPDGPAELVAAVTAYFAQAAAAGDAMLMWLA